MISSGGNMNVSSEWNDGNLIGFSHFYEITIFMTMFHIYL